ncbi:hypothetical protein M409DRAFT_67941 [Zasmidium cellare ATCC 36951]|uniref:HCP-like protein n=1 Tax=Zasmidium cellare ATCC 36951 TaxID=1080233 RepID=A0A6A6CDZ3_ZASCE|nr:uncharacterized protein M409DRAFT_67941 [Zasmidium cellare ATCC 36951]KAF2164450.1 hypothetical protein M409DRAFT_67941 [Zasmidium cellare ATCC 36951]
MAQTESAAQHTYTHPLPQTPVSPGREQWDDRDQEWAQKQPPAAMPGTPPLNEEYGARAGSPSSIQHTPPRQGSPVKRKAVPSPIIQHGPEVRIQDTPASPVSINPPQMGILEAETASIRQAAADDESRRSSRNVYTPDSSARMMPSDSQTSLPIRAGKAPVTNGHVEQRASYYAHSRSSSSTHNHPRIEEDGELHFSQEPEAPDSPGLQYHHFEDSKRHKPQNRVSQMTTQSAGSSSSGEHRRSTSHSLTGSQTLGVPRGLSRPTSAYNLGQDLRGRTLSPLSANGSEPGSPAVYGRDLSTSRRSPASRPTSYVDLLNNLPYSQQIAPGPPLNNQSLQSVVGSAASLLNTKKTLDMYRANVKKTNDAAVQYEFAIFMINAAQDALPEDGLDPNELQTEAKHILQRLSDRAYPFAQYYLGDGYFSGLFNKGKPDYDKAFPLFVAASKHGHAEAGYRAALCYEFGWGCAKSYPKAVQFYRNAASKNHPGAATRLGLACIRGDMGLKDKYREGIKWLKRASESADYQYNTGPYELGLMHLEGFGDDVFKDEAYAAQLLTQAAELGHVNANFLMGQAYENGLYGCPRDAALSVHFYNGAATKGHVEGMMALCAWYMVGAEPVLEKDEAEAFAWAKQAAETGYPKAEYAVGYFTEMGIGCRRDPLEANMWYVRAADQSYEQAKQRLAIIRAAASGDPGIPMGKEQARAKELVGGKEKKKFMGIF